MRTKTVEGPTRRRREWRLDGSEFDRPSFDDDMERELALLRAADVADDRILLLPHPADVGWTKVTIVVLDPPPPLHDPAPRPLADRLYTLPEAATFLSVSRPTVGNLAREGEIASVLVGRSRRIPGHELLRLLGHPAPSS